MGRCVADIPSHSSSQVLNSTDADRPFEVEGNTFVSIAFAEETT